MKTILLNCLPPVIENSPSPALSVLKQHLESKGYKVEIKYWNLILYPKLNSFFNLGNKILEDNLLKLLPFYAYISIKKKDFSIIEKIIHNILRNKPYLVQKGQDYIKSDLFDFIDLLMQSIDREIETMDLQKYAYFGFSSLFYQWIPANIIKDIIMDHYPEAKFIIGGFGTNKDAAAFLNNFPSWGYALWGEGEYSLLKFTEYIENDCELIMRDSIPNMCFVSDNHIITNKLRPKYEDLDCSMFDITDYMDEVKTLSQFGFTPDSIILPLERSRGCHWNRCRFCFLNSGYKYRVKSDEQVIKEITYYITKYGIKKFTFLDNDLIGKDNNRFISFLDKLIALREKYDFEFYLSEIESKNTDQTIIQKFKLAGFVNLQFGYESPSNNLLSKIKKKNTFASNLGLIKWCDELNIKIISPHIIRNLIEETDEDIKEGIWNLFFLRFLLNRNNFRHHYTNLAISSSSSYYENIKLNDEIKKYTSSKMKYYLPEGYIELENQFDLFLDITKPEYNKIWNIFENLENYYLNNSFSYTLIKQNNEVLFIEYINSEKIREVRLDQILFTILKLCNSRVSSIEELHESISHISSDKNKIHKAIINLRKEGILYSNDDMSELISIINTNLVLQ